MTIYASAVHGMDFDRWGAFGFSHESVRDQLARELKDGDLVLSFGTSGNPTPPDLQGRLLGLLTLGKRAVATEALVEPDLWRQHLQEYGRARWPYGLPIVSAEAFLPPRPVKNEILPRFVEENLHMKLATNYVALTPDEERLVLSLPRSPVSDIYASEGSSFAANPIRGRPGPRPTSGTRTLSIASGPAATYFFRLEGRHAQELCGGNPKLGVFKCGFSTDPARRLRAINAYFPDEAALGWVNDCEQWHRDEINAYDLEQAVFKEFARRGWKNLKGEIWCGPRADISSVLAAATATAKRSTGPITVDCEAF